MKQSPTPPFSKVTIKQKLIVAFAVPLILVLTVVLFTYIGIKKIQIDHSQIHETLLQAEEIPQKAELISMLEASEKTIRNIQSIILVETLLSIILMVLMGFLTIRSITLSEKKQ